MVSHEACSNWFQSRKRFLLCWSVTAIAELCKQLSISIAKAIPSLLEPFGLGVDVGRTRVSIAKAIPSLLERYRRGNLSSGLLCFNRESDSFSVGAPAQKASGLCLSWFQSRKRFLLCWSSCDAHA